MSHVLNPSPDVRRALAEHPEESSAFRATLAWWTLVAMECGARGSRLALQHNGRLER